MYAFITGSGYDKSCFLSYSKCTVRLGSGSGCTVIILKGRRLKVAKTDRIRKPFFFFLFIEDSLVVYILYGIKQ